MLEHHLKCLKALDEITIPDGVRACHFKPIIEQTGMDRPTVRRIVRHLARKGLAEFYSPLWDDDGRPAGAGYCITEAGRATLSDNRAEKDDG